MAVVFDPFSGNLVNVGSSSGGGGGGSTAPYVRTFTISDWSSPISGTRYINVAGATHTKGLNPMIQVFELNGSSYEEVFLQVEVDSATGDVALTITNTTDLRFDGKVVIR
mgnify:CR=1 FL=1